MKIQTLQLLAPVTLEAAAQTNDGNPLRSFKLLAYTGGLLFANFYRPVVVELSGVRKPAQSLPVFFNHERTSIVGHTTEVSISASDITASGVISGTGDRAKEVLETAANDFPWQASIGARPTRIEEVEAGETTTVNGRTFRGPIIVARESELIEISFVTIGADSKTKAIVASGVSMEFHDWLKASGFDPATLDETQKKTLLAAFNANQKPVEKPKPEVDPTTHYRERAAIEAKRIADIYDICAAANPNLRIVIDGQPTAIEAHAIAQGWSADQTKLAILEAQLAHTDRTVKAPSNTKPANEVLEASFAQTLGLNVDNDYKPEVLEAARSTRFRGIGIQRLLLLAAQENGYNVSPGEKVSPSNLRPILQAAFSGNTLPQIFSNVANKEIATGYMEEDQTWREIAVVKSVTDFKAVTVARLLDDVLYEEVGEDGEIKHGTMSEEYYTRQARTYAKMLSLSRKAIINDDAGAFDDLRNRLGRGASRKLSHLVWAAFMDNASFFTSARGNYISGATTNLGSDGVGLALGVKAFRNLSSPATEGSPRKKIGGMPDRLIVPPDLEAVADSLYASRNVVGDADRGDANIYFNKYKPVVSPWLADSSFTGYSATAWYLLRNPAILAAVVVSALNGRVEPEVESADADFNVLGIQFRGYSDVGVDQAEYLAGVMSKGAA